MEMRCYGKVELARRYFPMLGAEQAMRKLRRWIRRNPQLDEALARCHVSKNADFWSRKQVQLIVDYLDEP